ncbi:YgaP family membrane protein [Deinococcus aerophilus]|uniref:Inner membrane protein YgaP-like transmembrane domain-containing protein n=1 Tax=Deinococcus aerophilus TaxID=522488 RepID=A0ABQ2GZ77_9DEIO|nr:DUF2892 domain-containing protein [Deinococcus aerophilus]GGM21086.1 hypothetical protein GCM10010841_31330 [Deinococcus aerophilus]
MTTKQFMGFMAAPQGRGLRVGVGLVLIAWGTTQNKPAAATLGVVPLLAGVFDVCLLAPLFRLPFQGDDLRRRTPTPS